MLHTTEPTRIMDFITEVIGIRLYLKGQESDKETESLQINPLDWFLELLCTCSMNASLFVNYRF